MQSMVANTILKRKSGKNDASITSVLSPFINDGVWSDNFTTIMSKCIHFACVLAFVPLVFRQVYRVVSEKETRAKEVMLMMGMNPLVYWALWFFWWTMNNLFICVAMASVLKYGGAFDNCEWTVLFAIFFVYGQALFSYMLVAQSLFFKSLQASLVSTLLYFGTATLQFLINPYGVARLNKLILSTMFPPVAFCEGLFAFVKYEGSVGATFATLDLQFNKISVQDSLICMTIGGCYMFVLGVILEVTSPKEFGSSFDLMALCKKRQVFASTSSDKQRVQEGDW